MTAARDVAQHLAGRPMAGLRAVRPGTGGVAWMVAFGGPAFLCLDESLQPVDDLARVRDVAQALRALGFRSCRDWSATGRNRRYWMKFEEL